MSFRLPSPLYAIVDPLDGDPRTIPTLAAALLDGGARLLQLRWKAGRGAALLAAAHACAASCRASGAVFLVNDRVDVALACDADGVHLGQSDLPITAARGLLGPRRCIGVSTHDAAQAREAAAAGADYVAYGPIFPTETKETGYEPRGLESLREVRAAIDRPLVAIGGIRAGNAAAARAAGADAVAMISELCGAADVAAKVREVLTVLDSARRRDP